jgi:23S rRNA (pseudouridine1915-N3)-methyltransferase
MKCTLATTTAQRGRTKSEALDRLAEDYIERLRLYAECEGQAFASEGALLEWADRQKGRTRAFVILLDSRGKEYSSEELAGRIERLRDEGTQRLVFAVGPADGWSTEARQRADLLLSLGRMTLPHQLARVVLAEQVYRAFTIMAGHPYHSGH